MDSRVPRDGRALEELGTYDPMVPETDARAIMNRERVDYWLSVGALPTEKVGVLIKKYGTGGTHVDAQKLALERLAQPAAIPDQGTPASLPKAKEEPKDETKVAADAEASPEAAEAAASESAEETDSAKDAPEAPAEEATSDADESATSDEEKPSE